MNLDELIEKLQEMKQRILQTLDVSHEELLKIEDSQGLNLRSVTLRIPDDASPDEALSFESVHFTMEGDEPEIVIEAALT